MIGDSLTTRYPSHDDSSNVVGFVDSWNSVVDEIKMYQIHKSLFVVVARTQSPGRGAGRILPVE